MFNYFRGKLQPITMDVNQLDFDQNVMLVLEINQRGKLVHHELFEYLHPDYQKALEDAVNNLPKFKPVNGEKVTYSIGISF